MCCGSLVRESAGQNMTFSLENKHEVDTTSYIVVRQAWQPSTLHDIEVDMAQTMQEPCDAISCVGKHKELHPFTAHVID